MQIIVRAPEGFCVPEISVAVELTDTVGDVKRKLCQQHRDIDMPPPEQISLLGQEGALAGMRLDGGRLLADLGITKDCILSMSVGPAPSAAPAGLAYATVDLTASGTFKYVLLTATAPGGARVTLVRGYAGCEYHDDVREASEPALLAAGLSDITCVGGGRIRHDAGKKLFIYGYSQGFGRADHATTEKLCREKYPSYEISWSNDGY